MYRSILALVSKEAVNGNCKNSDVGSDTDPVVTP